MAWVVVLVAVDVDDLVTERQDMDGFFPLPGPQTQSELIPAASKQPHPLLSPKPKKVTEQLCPPLDYILCNFCS